MTQQRLKRSKTRSSPRPARPSKAGRVRAKRPESFVVNDFVSLALSLRQPLATHNVPSEVRASLIEDVIFRFATFIDEKTGSGLHESINSVLGEYSEQLADVPEPIDFLVAEMEVVFLKGAKAEFNILRSHLDKPAALRLVIELALGVRDITEIRSRVDIELRFRRMVTRKGGIRAVRFKPARSNTSSWQEIPFNGSPHGNFEQSLAGLIACAEVVYRQCT